MKKLLVISSELVVIILILFLLPTTNYQLFTVHAQGVDIGKHFGFGGIKSLGQATSQLMTPFFSIASFLVIMYFLAGAFKYLRSGGNKDEVEGGKQMIVHAIIGFLLLMLTFLVLQFMLSSLFGVTGFQIF